MSVEAVSERSAPVRWDIVRAEYEERHFLPAVICQRHGITPAQLRYRREVEGWLSSRARVVRQDDLVARMLKVLDKQIRRLEGAVDLPIDKQANVLGEVERFRHLAQVSRARRHVPCKNLVCVGSTARTGREAGVKLLNAVKRRLKFDVRGQRSNGPLIAVVLIELLDFDHGEPRARENACLRATTAPVCGSAVTTKFRRGVTKNLPPLFPGPADLAAKQYHRSFPR